MLGPGALRERHGKAFPVAQAGDNAHPASGCDAVPTLLPVLCPPSAQMQTSPTHPALALGVPIPVQEWPQAIGFSKGNLGDTGCWTQRRPADHGTAGEGGEHHGEAQEKHSVLPS